MEMNQPNPRPSVGEFVNIYRLGFFMADIGEYGTDIHQLIEDTVGILRGDSRVTEIVKPDVDVNWMNVEGYWPHCANPHAESLLDGSDRMRVPIFSHPIVFRIRVPRKNQPTFWPGDEPASEEYVASWNGCAVVVGWRQPDRREISKSGGHPVFEILTSCAQTQGRACYVQACNPACQYQFVHTDMRMHEREENTDIKFEGRGEGEWAAQFSMPIFPSIDEAMGWLNLTMSLVAEPFARYKNIGRRILDIEAACRHDLDGLLWSLSQHSYVDILAPWRWFHVVRRRRGERRAIGRLWIFLANLERLQRMWNHESMKLWEDYAEGSVEQDLVRLFDRDVSEGAEVGSLDLSLIREAVGQASSRLDNRAVVAATAWGALAGGIAGAAAGAAM